MPEMVMVACKHPNGVILNLDHYVVVNPSNNLIRRVNGGASVKLNGWAHRFNAPDPAQETGGYVLTAVPADFWAEWIASHKDFPMIEDKTIMGPPAKGHAADQALAHADVPKMHAPSDGELRAAELTRD